VFLSAVSGEGMARLRQRLAEFALSRQPDAEWHHDPEDLVLPHDPAG
jgi:hypothetical protein